MRLFSRRKSSKSAQPAATDDGAAHSLAPQILIEEKIPVTEEGLVDADLLKRGFSVWDSLREGQQMPEWSSFKPSQHPEFLPHIMLYEKQGDRYFVRLTGQECADYLPIKATNRFLDEVMPALNLADMILRFDLALETGQPNYARKRTSWHDETLTINYQSLQLPFRNGDHPRLMSLMQFDKIR